MATADNVGHLARIAAQRHQATLKRANDAIEALDRSGQPVTFAGVAAAAGVSRSWLYRQPDIRALVDRLRDASSLPGAAPAGQRATMESLRSRAEAYRTEITRLRAENTMLRDEAARRLGHQRAEPGNTRLPGQS